MKISQNYPQFEQTTALFIVTGGQDGKLFVASEGEIQKLAAFHVEMPKYTDREGWAGLKKHQKQTEQEYFTNVLTTQLQKILAGLKPDEAYLFTPAPLKNIVAKELPNGVSKKIKKIITGNYIDLHPFGLLALLKGEKPAKQYDSPKRKRIAP